MTDPRILRCIYEGTHRPIEDSFRYPIRPQVSPALESVPSKPQPIPYYTTRYCRACNVEETILHGLPERTNDE